MLKVAICLLAFVCVALVLPMNVQACESIECHDHGISYTPVDHVVVYSNIAEIEDLDLQMFVYEMALMYEIDIEVMDIFIIDGDIVLFADLTYMPIEFDEYGQPIEPYSPIFTPCWFRGRCDPDLIWWTGTDLPFQGPDDRYCRYTRTLWDGVCRECTRSHTSPSTQRFGTPHNWEVLSNGTWMIELICRNTLSNTPGICGRRLWVGLLGDDLFYQFVDMLELDEGFLSQPSE